MSKPKGKLKGIHHAYLGAFIFIACFILAWKVHILFGQIGCPLGLAICLDDVLQHFFGWNTPIFKINNWLWQNFVIYQRLCEWWDKILGKE